MERGIKQNRDKLMTHPRQHIDTPHLRQYKLNQNYSTRTRIIPPELEGQIGPQFSTLEPLGNKVLIPQGTEEVELALFSEN